MPSLRDLRRAIYYRLFSADGCLAGLPSTARVLDVGCGDGRASEVLSVRCADGLDIYGPALGRASRAGRRTRVVQADVRSVPYRTGSYDVVVALDVVEHFTKPEAVGVLDELERVAGDRVIVVTPQGYATGRGNPCPCRSELGLRVGPQVSLWRGSAVVSRTAELRNEQRLRWAARGG